MFSYVFHSIVSLNKLLFSFVISVFSDDFTYAMTWNKKHVVVAPILNELCYLITMDYFALCAAVESNDDDAVTILT